MVPPIVSYRVRIGRVRQWEAERRNSVAAPADHSDALTPSFAAWPIPPGRGSLKRPLDYFACKVIDTEFGAL